MRPGKQRFRNVCLGHLKNCPVTKGDAVAAEDMFGRNLGSLKGKTPHTTAKHVPAGVDPVPPEIMKIHRDVTIAIDIMYVNKIPFFITVSRDLRFGTIESLADCRVSTVISKLRSVMKLYEHRGFRVINIMADHEFEPLRPQYPMLNTCAKGEHVPETERYI